MKKSVISLVLAISMLVMMAFGAFGASAAVTTIDWTDPVDLSAYFPINATVTALGTNGLKMTAPAGSTCTPGGSVNCFYAFKIYPNWETDRYLHIDFEHVNIGALAMTFYYCDESYGIHDATNLPCPNPGDEGKDLSNWVFDLDALISQNYRDAYDHFAINLYYMDYAPDDPTWYTGINRMYFSDSADAATTGSSSASTGTTEATEKAAESYEVDLSKAYTEDISLNLTATASKLSMAIKPEQIGSYNNLGNAKIKLDGLDLSKTPYMHFDNDQMHGLIWTFYICDDAYNLVDGINGGYVLDPKANVNIWQMVKDKNEAYLDGYKYMVMFTVDDGRTADGVPVTINRVYFDEKSTWSAKQKPGKPAETGFDATELILAGTLALASVAAAVIVLRRKERA